MRVLLEDQQGNQSEYAEDCLRSRVFRVVPRVHSRRLHNDLAGSVRRPDVLSKQTRLITQHLYFSRANPFWTIDITVVAITATDDRQGSSDLSALWLIVLMVNGCSSKRERTNQKSSLGHTFVFKKYFYCTATTS